MAIVFSGIIACIQGSNSSDLNAEHARAHNVAGTEARHFNSIEVNGLIEMHTFNHIHTGRDIFIVVQHSRRLFIASSTRPTKSRIVVPDQLANGLSRLCHNDFPSKPCMLKEIRYGPAMVQMEM